MQEPLKGIKVCVTGHCLKQIHQHFLHIRCNGYKAVTLSPEPHFDNDMYHVKERPVNSSKVLYHIPFTPYTPYTVL